MSPAMAFESVRIDLQNVSFLTKVSNLARIAFSGSACLNTVKSRFFDQSKV